MGSDRSSVRELIRQLKSKFLSTEFQQVEQILTDRECELKEDLVKAKAKYEMMDLKCLRLETELKEQKWAAEESKEKVTKLTEDMISCSERATRAEEQCSYVSFKLLECEEEKRKLIKKIAVCNEEKHRAARSSCKSKFEDLDDARVDGLEGNVILPSNQGPVLKRKIELLDEEVIGEKSSFYNEKTATKWDDGVSSSAGAGSTTPNSQKKNLTLHGDRENEMQKNMEISQAETDMIRVKCLRLEVELRQHKRVKEEMAERVTTLTEDLSLSSERVKRADEKYAKCEAEKRELMDKITVGKEQNTRNLEKVARLTEDLSLSSERVKRAEEKCAKVSREILEHEAEKRDLIEKIKVLNGDKSRAEEELGVWKKKYLEIGARVAQLEQEMITLSNCDTCSKPKTEIATDNERSAGKPNNGILTSPGAEQPKSFTVIDIDDSDDEDGLVTRKTCVENLKRKRDSTVVNGDNDNFSDGNIRQKKLQEHVNVPKSSFAAPPTSQEQGFITPCTKKPEKKLHPQVLLSSSDSDDTLVNENDYYSDLNRTISNLQTREWAHEADMLSAFDKNKELCLSAVCALHRQICSRGNSSESSMTFRSKGFTMLDAQRIARLAVLLTNGDVQGKPKKPISELENSDIEECQNLAKRYSTQLFNIHREKEDPFFLPL